MKWDYRFLEMARMVASWSKDPSTKTGAVIVDPYNRVVSVGYNGFPADIVDDDRLHTRDLKYEMIVHCEINAIVFAQRNLLNCTLYTWPFMSCSRCASIVIQAGVLRHVAPKSDADCGRNERWQEAFKLSHQLFEEAGVEVVLY